MGVLGISLGVAALACTGLALATNRPYNRHPDAVSLGAVMLGVWLLSAYLDTHYSPPDSKILNPLIDVILAAITGAMWFTRRERWKLWVVGFIALQVCAHVVYQTVARVDGVLGWYIGFLNVTYFATLGAIGWPGGGVVVRWVGEHLRDHRHPHSVAGVG